MQQQKDALQQLQTAKREIQEQLQLQSTERWYGKCSCCKRPRQCEAAAAEH